MKEIWKDIRNYEGLYEASTLGRIRNNKGHIMKQRYTFDGYLQINLHKDGKTETKRVHRLIAETFLDNPNNYPEINHKDEDKTNNSLSNIEWCSHIYNQRYGTRVERVKDKLSYSIIQYDEDGYPIAYWNSLKECSKFIGIHFQRISEILSGKRKSFEGFRFERVA